MPLPEEEVHTASKRFYAALNLLASGDHSSMAGSWSHGQDVTSQHPIKGRQVWWSQVREPKLPMPKSGWSLVPERDPLDYDDGAWM